MTFLISAKQVLSGSNKANHKLALKLLKKAIEGHFASLSDYRFVEGHLLLEKLDLVDEKKVSDRLYLHRQEADLNVSEFNLGVQVLKDDKESNLPFLDVHIVMNQLRSAFNVGSILRTTEAMRLGCLFFEGITPKVSNDKVQKTAMGCADRVSCFDLEDTSILHHPIIGLETAQNAVSIYDYKFPEKFTLVLGNEEYGLSDHWLKKSDIILSIPMYGFKNSLNVASAFAITAFEIRRQLSMGSISN